MQACSLVSSNSKSFSQYWDKKSLKAKQLLMIRNVQPASLEETLESNRFVLENAEPF